MRAVLDVVAEKKSISALPRVEQNSKLKFMNLAGNRTANRTANRIANTTANRTINRTANRTAKPHEVADQSFNVNKAKKW